jgi:SAM-dependent methyltransferase
MDLKEQSILGHDAKAHWYYRAKSAAMLKMLRGAPIDEVLDVGAGSGFFARHLLDHTEAAAAICVDPNYDLDHSEIHNGKKLRFARGVRQFGGHLVLMMDVLEHVPDDAALLAEYVARVPAGTRFLITVPAMQWMWSEHDVFLEHYRRYSVRQLDLLMARAGLTRLASCYFFGLALPLAAAVRFGRKILPGRARGGSDMRRHTALVNWGLWLMCWLELWFFRVNRVGGLSVFALGQKT